VNPTGAQFPISFGEYRAVVTEVGACLRELWHADRQIVRGFAESESMPLYRGAVLAPWPNRIRDGQYPWAGQVHQLPLNESERNCALHGLVAWLQWRCEEHDSQSVTLSCKIWPQPGYPFLLSLRVTYRLGSDGLAITLAAQNQGSSAAPYGCSIHPYLAPGRGPIDSWKLHLPASAFVTVDQYRLLPIGTNTVTETAFDFRRSRTLAGIVVDHAFTELEFDVSGYCEALVTAEDGSGVAMTWDRRCEWVQIHTADRPELEYNRTALVVEPMSCPPDAFRSGEGLRTLQPGAVDVSSWRLSHVPAAN
jgi:aldose 1-epimerase